MKERNTLIRITLKAIMVLIMLACIIFSIFNFSSVKTTADTAMGVWEHFPDGTWKCLDEGTACKKTSLSPVSEQ